MRKDQKRRRDSGVEENKDEISITERSVLTRHLVFYHLE